MFEKVKKFFGLLKSEDRILENPNKVVSTNFASNEASLAYWLDLVIKDKRMKPYVNALKFIEAHPVGEDETILLLSQIGYSDGVKNFAKIWKRQMYKCQAGDLTKFMETVIKHTN